MFGRVGVDGLGGLYFEDLYAEAELFLGDVVVAEVELLLGLGVAIINHR